jgi:membrane-associated protease RseP (regulator of RpoE activity)
MNPRLCSILPVRWFVSGLALLRFWFVPLVVATLGLVALPSALAQGVSAEPSASNPLPEAGAAAAVPGAPVVLEPYVVDGAPLGYFGIKRAMLHFNFWRLVTFRKGLRFIEIQEVHDGSPVALAGVLPGDRIVAVNGRPMNEWSLAKLERLYADAEIGTIIAADIVRPGTERKLRVEVRAGAMPKKTVAHNSRR